MWRQRVGCDRVLAGDGRPVAPLPRARHRDDHHQVGPTHVPAAARVLRRGGPPGHGGQVHRCDGRGAHRLQALPLRLSSLVVAGRRQGRSARALAPLHPPGRTVQRRGAAQTGRLVREGQAHQQRDGQVWPGN